MSTSLEVIPVRTRKEQKTFVELAWTLNRHDPNWIPPLRLNHEKLLGFRKHSFYENAAIQTFLALRGGQPVGRIAAIENRAHNQWHQDKIGFAGFFQSINEQAVANALFDTASEWLRQRGLTSVRGPADPSINYEWGLLVDGFDTPPYFMLTHNPEYYGRLWEGAGFVKSQDMYGFWADTSMIGRLQSDKKIVSVDTQLRERFGINIRGMHRGRFRAEVEMFLDIYNQALTATWGYVPMGRSEVLQLAGELKQLIVPELTRIAEIDGKPIGVMFGLLDYNTRIKQIDGRLFPFGFIRLLANKHAIKRIRLVSTNVLPEYQNWGVGVCLARAMLQPALDHGVTSCEFSWVLETNDLSRKTLEKGGTHRYKTWRLYDRPLGA